MISPGEPSFVEIDGQRFYADRCYLNAMAGSGRSTADADMQLFSRSRLVAALASSEADGGLESCIFTSFSVDVPDLESEFPALFAPGSRVPTLLLHGDRQVRRSYADAPGQPYRVWKEVVQDNTNVEMPRGWQRTPFWDYSAMDARIQVGGIWFVFVIPSTTTPISI